jgi:2-oxoglutarate ferredoxin oxidoreductase subunit beta
MTGGQVAPTTPMGLKTMTSPFGNLENFFDPCKLAIGSGATYVARWTVYHALQITKAVRAALNHHGFSFIEIVSQCPVQFGRKSGMGNTAAMFDYFKERAVNVTKAAEMTSDELTDKIVVGELLNIDKPVLDDELAKLRAELRERSADGEI